MNKSSKVKAIARTAAVGAIAAGTLLAGTAAASAAPSGGGSLLPSDKSFLGNILSGGPLSGSHGLLGHDLFSH